MYLISTKISLPWPSDAVSRIDIVTAVFSLFVDSRDINFISAYRASSMPDYSHAVVAFGRWLLSAYLLRGNILNSPAINRVSSLVPYHALIGVKTSCRLLKILLRL